MKSPPGPPYQIDIFIEVSGDDYESMKSFTLWLKQKIYPIITYHNVIDYYDDSATYQSQYNIKLDQEMITRLGLDAQQISRIPIWIVFEWTNVDVFHKPWAKTVSNIYLSFLDEQKNAYDILEKINFTNNTGKKVYLSEIAKIEKNQADNMYYSEDKEPSINIYWEIANWWVIYPVANIIKRFYLIEFWEWKYKLKSIDFYSATIKQQYLKRIQNHIWMRTETYYR